MLLPLKSFHHISITFSWQLDGVVNTISFFKTHVHTNVMEMWWESHDCMDISLSTIVEHMISSNCHKNVMGMWCQEKNNMQIEILVFQNYSFFSSESPPVNNFINISNNLTCFYKIFAIKMKHFVDNINKQYLKILLNLVTLLVCYCLLVPLSD